MNTKLLLILLVALAQQESRPKVAPMKEGSRLTGVILEENPPKELKMQSCAANDSQVYEFVQTYTKSSPEEKTVEVSGNKWSLQRKGASRSKGVRKKLAQPEFHSGGCPVRAALEPNS